MGDESPQAAVSVEEAGLLQHDGLFWRRLAHQGSVSGPEVWKRMAPTFIGFMIFLLVGANRRGAIANLQRILGDRGFWKNNRAALRMFVEFSKVFSETCQVQHADIAGLGIEKALNIDLPPDLDLATVFANDKGVIALTSHFGCWEIGARVMRRFDRPVNLVMAHEGNPTVQAFQEEMRAQHGLKIIHSDDSPFASVEMLRALARGEIVAMQLDRAAPGQVTREVEFFGRKAPFQVGPFHLARAAGVPLWPVFSVQEGRKQYKLLASNLYRIPRRADDAVLASVMNDVVGLFEKRVRQYPFQWFQFQDFWAREKQ
jgi:lauroyl/myristoyl acyltransferase